MQPQDLLLALVQRTQKLVHCLVQLPAHHFLIGLGRLRILQQRLQGSAVVIPRGNVQRADVRRQLGQLGQAALFRDLRGGGFLPQFLTQGGAHRFDLPHPLRRVQRYPDGAAVVHQAPGHALPDPFCGISGKTVILGIIKFPRRHQKADTALLNQVHQRDAPSGVLSRDGHHQTQIGIDHLANGALVSLGAAHGKLPLLLRRQTGVPPDLI